MIRLYYKYGAKMIGSDIPIPVNNDDGEYSVPTKTVGENKLESSVTEAVYSLQHTMKDVLCELQLLNERVEATFKTQINRTDIEEC